MNLRHVKQHPRVRQLVKNHLRVEIHIFVLIKPSSSERNTIPLPLSWHWLFLCYWSFRHYWCLNVGYFLLLKTVLLYWSSLCLLFSSAKTFTQDKFPKLGLATWSCIASEWVITCRCHSRPTWDFINLGHVHLNSFISVV